MELDNDSNFKREVTELANQIGELCDGKDTRVILAAVGIQSAAVISQTQAPSIIEEYHKEYISDILSKMLKKMKRKNKIN